MVTRSIVGRLSLAAAASSMQVEVASDPLGRKLLRDILFDADGNLHDRASLLKRNEGRDLVPARILSGQLDVEDWHESARLRSYAD